MDVRWNFLKWLHQLHPHSGAFSWFRNQRNLISKKNAVLSRVETARRVVSNPAETTFEET